MKMKRIITFVMAVTLAVTAAAQEKRWAVVELSTAYLRNQPDYESALETQELMGTVVEILGKKSYWREIMSPQPYRAWVTNKVLVEMNEEQLKEYKKAPKVMFTALYGHLYEAPSAESPTICDLVGGDLMRPTGKTEGNVWTEVMLPSGRTGWVLSDNIRRHEGFISIPKGEGNAQSISDQKMENILAEARKLLGVPYIWGGMCSRGVDCSGLVRISYIMNDVLLPRNASQQIHCGDKVPMKVDPRFWDKSQRGTAAFTEEMKNRISNLKRGDLVFFGSPATEGKPQRITHVGIYIGNNHIIHASHVVRINSLIPTDPDYYENSHRLLTARRL